MRLQTASAVAGYQGECRKRVEVLRVGESIVLVVADGVDGTGGSTRAANLAIEYIVAGALAMPIHDWDDHNHWDGLLRGIDEWLAQDDQAGETTAVVAAVSPPTIPDLIVGACAGDSSAWLIMADGYDDLTENQRLDCSQAAYPGFLGSGLAMPFWFSEGLGNSTLLLATDGLFKYADPDAICQICREVDLESGAQRLIDLVRLPSGQLLDDVAVALCRRA